MGVTVGIFATLGVMNWRLGLTERFRADVIF
jgi:hypothetical protein